MKKMSEEKWLEDLRKASESFEMEPPQELWREIERDLDKIMPANQTLSSKSIATPLWKRYAAIAASIAAVISLSLLLIYSPTIDTPSPTPSTACIDNTTTQKAVTALQISKHTPHNHQNAILCHNSLSYKNTEPTNAYIPADTAYLQNDAEVVSHQTLDETEENRLTNNGINPPENRKDSEQQSSITQKNIASLNTYNYNIPAVKSASTKLKIGAFANVSTLSIFQKHLSSDSYGISPSSGLFDNASAIKPEIKPAIISERHKTPIKFGVSLNYPLSTKFSIESGLTYSKLSSEIKYSAIHLYKAEQELHYIGIPIKIDFSAIQTNRFRIYMGLGGTIEKCVYGEQWIKNLTSTNAEPSKKTATEKELQFSLSANAGAQFDIIPSIGVFVEPGLGYYFNNHSDIRNIYKYQNLQPEIKFGLRLNL